MSTLNELVYYCKEANSFGALMFTGKWGCGKTYLIDNELSKELGNDYIIIRVSLFGESSVSSINKKVQKAYFQNMMLNMGSYIEDMAQHIPGVTDEKAIKIGEKTGKLSETINHVTEKANTSKVGGFFRFIHGIAEKIPGAEKILSMNPSDYVSVEKNIADKKVILVFDDLERSNLNEVDVLGCINEYCENKQIKTIIIANEDKILEKYIKPISDDKGDDCEVHDEENLKSLEGKIGYSEIKEKIVTRTVKNIPDYNKIITQILSKFIANDPQYKLFLLKHRLDLINVFNCGNSENIRSLKCAVQDFQRVFIELKENEVDEELYKYMQSFVAFVLRFKEGKIRKSERYGYLLCDYEVEKEYPGFFIRRYMLSGVKKWITEGEWDASAIKNEIIKMTEAKKATKPIDLVRNSDLIYLDENTINKGLPDVISLAYNGGLFIDEYIALLRNIMWAREISYILPVEIDMCKIKEGVKKCLNTLKDNDEPDTNVRSMIHPDNLGLLTDDERDVYMTISKFRENNVQMFAINKRKYLKALYSEDIKELYESENKRFNVFDKEMAQAVMKRYITLTNAERQVFNGVFNKMWGNCTNSQDIIKQISIIGFTELRDMLNANRTQELAENYGLRAALSKMLIQSLDKIIVSLETEIEKEKKSQNNI